MFKTYAGHSQYAGGWHIDKMQSNRHCGTQSAILYLSRNRLACRSDPREDRERRLRRPAERREAAAIAERIGYRLLDVREEDNGCLSNASLSSSRRYPIRVAMATASLPSPKLCIAPSTYVAFKSRDASSRDRWAAAPHGEREARAREDGCQRKMRRMVSVGRGRPCGSESLVARAECIVCKIHRAAAELLHYVQNIGRTADCNRNSKRPCWDTLQACDVRRNTHRIQKLAQCQIYLANSGRWK